MIHNADLIAMITTIIICEAQMLLKKYVSMSRHISYYGPSPNHQILVYF